MKKIILIPIIMLIMALTAIAWTPTGNIDLRNYYSVINATNVSSAGFWLTSGANCCNGINYTYVAGTGLVLTGNSFSWNTTYGDARYLLESNEANLNVNSSTYWDGETSQADLNVNHSDLCTALDVPYSADETFINLLTKTFTFNETYGNTKWIQVGNEANLNVNSSVYWDGETSQADLNVNSSDYWDGLNVPSDLNYLILSDWTNITNRPVNLSQFFNDADFINKTFADGNYIGWANESDLNVNSSNYWGNYNFASDLDYQILSGWTNLSDYPLACPAGTFVTEINDSITCTGINVSSLNYQILSSWQNITDRLTNLTQFTDDIDYSAKNVNYSDTSGTAITWDGETSQADLNVNSSNFWDNYNVASDLNYLILSDWTNITNKFITAVDNIYIYMSGTTATFNETKLNTTINDTISTRLATTTYLPTSYDISSGTGSGGNNLGNLSYYDNQYFNITEASGASPLTFYVNFTGVTTITNLNMRERYLGGSGHEIVVELWDNVLGAWEGYADITDQSGVVVSSIPVLDPTDHITGGLVQLRFRHIQNGIPSHKLIIDFVTLSNGITSYTTNDHDSLSGRDNPENHPQYLLIDGTRNMTGNMNMGGYNLTTIDRLCWNSGCTAYQYFNGTCIIIVGLTNTTEVC